MTTTIATLPDLLSFGADEAPAITVVGGGPPLRYGPLRASIASTGKRLSEIGVGHDDRVAIVLDGGPELAVCFLAVASACGAAPLNPAYKAEEFEFYLTDLRAKLLIVAAGAKSASIGVAARLRIPVAELHSTPGEGAGTFRLSGPDGFAASPPGAARPGEAEDIALLLHTSGTTSRPKMVALSHRNVCASAGNVRKTLALTAADRGLSIMPLFHIHGLVAGLLAPLSAGGEVCCTPGFNALSFFRWVAEVHPTWYTAVPTMHQAILARAAQNRQTIQANPLRFIRSSSAPMPPQVIRELEQAFGAPVVESYGMTEAAHQMASNPLPPGRRKMGTVGQAAGSEIAIMDPQGMLLPPDTTGEVVIRGPTVTSGYVNNDKANGEAFTGGWFRTGDQGVLDADGYLTITGRIKEIIIRGGEKISPREVDEVLMDHPAVRQALTFAVPHEMLGEEVGAAVVLGGDATVTDKDLRAFCATRLAQFKVPRTIVIVDEIPKGPTGKPQRIGLAEKLGLGAGTRK
jgi:oxalate---CoA ligase